jgi:NitT/TauT family transport system substrate-binding protein
MKRLAVSLFLALLVVGGALRLGVASFTTLFAPPQPLVITIPSHFGSSLVVVADQQGDFRRHGIAASVRQRESGRVALAEMTQGRADFAVVAETPFVRATLLGEKPMILCGIASVDGHHTVVAARAAGIRSARDLVGKRVGVSRGTSSEYFLERILRYYALSSKSVVRVNVDSDHMAEALRDGKVDAVCTWKPWEFSPRDVVKLPGDGIYTWNFFLVARRETVERRPELCRRVVASLLDAENYALRHHGNLPARLAPVYGMDLKSFENYWATVRLNVDLDHAMIRSLEEETRWVMTAGVGAGQPMPDYVDCIAFRPLETLEPGAVTIVHERETL